MIVCTEGDHERLKGQVRRALLGERVPATIDEHLRALAWMESHRQWFEEPMFTGECVCKSSITITVTEEELQRVVIT